MSVKSRKKRSEPETFKTNWSTYLGRGITTVVSVVLIFYVALLAASRTQGFRSLVAERFELFTGLEVEVEESRLTPGLTLTSGGISASHESGRKVPALSIDELSIEWERYRLFSPRDEDIKQVRVKGLEAHIQRKGEILPKGLRLLAPAGAFAGRGEIQRDVRLLLSRISDLPRAGVPMEVEGPLMCWWLGERKELQMEDFVFTYSPAQREAPVARLFSLNARALSRSGSSVLGPIELECLQKGRDIAFLKARADEGTQPRPR